jgi:hypothetical protein
VPVVDAAYPARTDAAGLLQCAPVMAWALPRDLQTRIEATDPTGVPASAVVAALLVVLVLVVLSLAVRWSVNGIGPTHVATVQE